MTAKTVLLESDIDDSILQGKRIGIVGYGSQGRAQALNLRDSGFAPLIGLRKGKSSRKAGLDGFSPLPVSEVARRSEIIVLLTPDETHHGVYNDEIIPNARDGAFVGFATGFSVHFGLVEIPETMHAFLAAPKGPGDILRNRYKEGSGIPALVGSLGQDQVGLRVAMAYAKAIGCARVGVIETTFGEESVADLFGEQSVLSGGLIELMRAAFDVLVENGYSPEVAYIECISEVEYMASLVSRVGLDRLEEHISSTAYFGGTTRGRRIIDDRTRAKLKGMLKEIVDGEFLKEFKDYIASGAKIRGRGSNADLMKAARTNLGMGSEHEQ